MRNAFSISFCTHEGTRALGRSRHRWKDNIKMDVKIILCGIVDHLIQGRDQ
jgi:hypothetical protein